MFSLLYSNDYLVTVSSRNKHYEKNDTRHKTELINLPRQTNLISSLTETERHRHIGREQHR